MNQHLFHFGVYDFLWKDDMYGNFFDFIRHDPGINHRPFLPNCLEHLQSMPLCMCFTGVYIINKEVERMLKIERKVLDIPVILPVGPICLHTNPIKDSLHGFAMAWKNQYASVLHEEAKVRVPI